VGGADNVRVAGVLDLLRIADASPDLDARRSALAYRVVLEVQRGRCTDIVMPIADVAGRWAAYT
jgi:hypothetical protein